MCLLFYPFFTLRAKNLMLCVVRCRAVLEACAFLLLSVSTTCTGLVLNKNRFLLDSFSSERLDLTTVSAQGNGNWSIKLGKMS